ncbi:MAG TPA: CoA ester lyase [Solirubrobacterales bacterium]|nr:CoA ester lyase [Solirubrobacterales bacterium]
MGAKGSAIASPRRACLSVPGSSEKMLGKAALLAVDEVVIDLEDAVAPAAKEEARAATVAALEGLDWKATRVAVRANAPRSRWCVPDLLALAEAPVPPASIVLPKTDAPADVEFAERVLDGAETGAAAIGLQALIESPAAVIAAPSIAASSPRLESLILGYADLGAALGRGEAAASRPEIWLAAQEAVLGAARAAGLQAIDGPYLGTAVDPGLEAAAEWARVLGFDGKWVIHPAQIERVAEFFTPGEDEVAQARRVLKLLADAHDEQGAGAVADGDRMVDEAVAVAARNVLSRAGGSRSPE